MGHVFLRLHGRGVQAGFRVGLKSGGEDFRDGTGGRIPRFNYHLCTRQLPAGGLA